jgi:hypothetical protein
VKISGGAALQRFEHGKSGNDVPVDGKLGGSIGRL